MEILVGDVVAIRGDLRLCMNGTCQYTPDQLVLGRYVKHTEHGGVWTGVVEKVKGDMALVGGGWRGMERYEVMACGSPRAVMSNAELCGGTSATNVMPVTAEGELK